jgi:D-alanyl-lipoteichoic acid acyltransferase DltB (MBOAT superfamily)
MLFSSAEFIFVFLPAAVVLHLAAARRGRDAALVMTTASSLIFYAWWRPSFVLLPLLSVLGNFWLARAIIAAPERPARALLTLGIAANLLVLGYFKYCDFALSVIAGRPPHPPDVPLALSFTTFVQIAFLVEVWRRPGRIGLRTHALFVTFFPHLIAGPIVRWPDLGPQIAALKRGVDWDNVAVGLTIFCLGLGKKVLIADALAPHVAPVFEAAAVGTPLPSAAAWGAALAYTAQLYFDFSGYSDMAVGLGLLFNLSLPINFAAPLRATSIIDFWRRWHISLSQFLRDFVYVPLGGSGGGGVRRSFNLFATMALGGLWHGANWTFIAWGAFHGVLLAINHAWRSLRRSLKRTRAPSPIASFAGWLATFIAFVVGMVLFRAPDLPTALSMLVAMLGQGGAEPAHSLAVGWDLWGIREGYISEAFVRQWLGGYWSVVGSLWTLGALAVALFVPDTMEFVGYRVGEPRQPWRRPTGALRFRPSLPWLAVVCALVVWEFAKLGRFSEFLYYQF